MARSGTYHTEHTALGGALMSSNVLANNTGIPYGTRSPAELQPNVFDDYWASRYFNFTREQGIGLAGVAILGGLGYYLYKKLK